MVFDNDKIVHMISNLYTLTGTRTTVLDTDGTILFASPEEPAFCRKICATQAGCNRCQDCILAAVRNCREQKQAIRYSCHAGLRMTLLPIQVGGQTEAYLLIGPYLNTHSRQSQWENTHKQLSWYAGNRAALLETFNDLVQCSSRQVDAYLEIVQDLKSYMYLSGAAISGQYTDQQRLERYLDQHYTEQLTLSSISQDLNMGRTKLCALAKTMSGGRTLSQLITQRRISKACRLLLRTDLPISEISEAVGINDYNYFSKVFRQSIGLSPSAYRRSRGSGMNCFFRGNR